MKKTIILITVALFIVSMISLQAESNGKLKGKVTTVIDNGFNISLNANGGTSPSNGILNTLSFNPNLGLELFWGAFGIGLDAGTFTSKPNFNFDSYSSPLTGLDYISIKNTKGTWTSSYALIGPTLTLGRKHLGKPESQDISRHTPFHNKLQLTISLKGGLTLNETPDFSVTDILSSPPKNIAGYFPPTDYEKLVLSLKPNISFNYFITNNFAFNINAQYLMQTGQTEFATGYKDLSKVNFNLSNREVVSQISQAPKIITNTKGPDKYLSFGLGLTYSFRKGWDGTVKGGNIERKGWDGTVKGGNIQERGIDKKDTRKNEAGEIISMNVTIGKQTQGTTFGEKVNAGRINVTLVADGCIVLFPDKGYRVNTKEKTIVELSQNEHADFGKKVNAGLHAAGGALAQGASLLGGALPGGAVISAAVSSVGNLAGGAGGGAAAASYAKTSDKKKKKVWDSSRDDDCDGLMNVPDGDYEFEVVIEEKSSTKSKRATQTQVVIEFSSISNVLKTKHDTAKNSVGNIR